MEARKAAGLNKAQAITCVHRASVALGGFNRNQLDAYERGDVSGPDPVVLLVLAEIYRIDLVRLVSHLRDERDQLVESQSPPQGEQAVKRQRTGS
jgi:hypothetical protein